jgi:hypothetical protein
MPTTSDAVSILKRQYRESKEIVSRLDDAIRVLEKLSSRGKKRTISAAGRARIAAAQRKRWSKLRLVKKH